MAVSIFLKSTSPDEEDSPSSQRDTYTSHLSNAFALEFLSKEQIVTFVMDWRTFLDMPAGAPSMAAASLLSPRPVIPPPSVVGKCVENFPFIDTTAGAPKKVFVSGKISSVEDGIASLVDEDDNTITSAFVEDLVKYFAFDGEAVPLSGACLTLCKMLKKCPISATIHSGDYAEQGEILKFISFAAPSLSARVIKDPSPERIQFVLEYISEKIEENASAPTFEPNAFSGPNCPSDPSSLGRFV